MIDNLYAKYLLMDRIQKAAERAGTKVYKFDIREGHDRYRNDEYVGYGADIDIMLDVFFTSHTPESREEMVSRFLDELPLTMHREQGRISLAGVLNGFKVEVTCGTGVCEKVQVGTRIVPAEPAKPEREEPIFEVRCVDPLNELVTA